MMRKAEYIEVCRREKTEGESYWDLCVQERDEEEKGESVPKLVRVKWRKRGLT